MNPPAMLSRRSLLAAGWAAPAPPDLRHPGGEFNGHDTVIRLDPPRNLSGDFTIAVHVNTARSGDIASLYDPAARRGFGFGIRTNYVTTSPSNHRNVHFGIDDGVTGEWTASGRPGNAIHIFALTVFRGRLFAATCEAGENEAGHVWRYAGGTAWDDCGSPDPCNSVSALAGFNGELYAGVARYNTGGSSLPPSLNKNPGGRIYRLAADGRWIDCGKLGEADSVFALIVHQGRLYASTRYAPAGVYRYEGGQEWTFCGAPPGKRIEPMAVFRGALYGASFDGGEVFRYQGGTAWALAGKLPDTTQTYSFAIHGGRLYASTWPNALVFRYEADNNWTNCGRLGEEKETMGMAVYNGKLYAGTLPLAEVYRYDGDRRWTFTGRLDRTPDVRYRRAWSMAVFQGKLFCGTLPSGRVFSLEAGKSATWDHELPPGWCHLAAVRDKGRLRLYLDGALVSESAPFDSASYRLPSGRRLSIGLGDHDFFEGRLRDFRLYSRALGPPEILGLAKLSPGGPP